MDEAEFIARWSKDQPVYKAWGQFVVDTLLKALDEKGVEISSFLKVPAKFRLKDDESLIDKAFYRSGKNYSNPYQEIEDKVGVRMVVLLLEDIEKICEVVKDSNDWTFDPCKHFDQDKINDPLLFTYQSVHFILRPINDILVDEVTIPKDVPCELQIRTLLQHAHAELTHDAIYKAKRAVKPSVQRTVAKSMALIETTDKFFSEVTQELSKGPVDELSILDQLDGIYLSLTKITPCRHKSSIVIWDEFESLVDEDLVGAIEDFISKTEGLTDIIKDKYTNNHFYKQSTVLFIYWLLKRKRARLLRDWPLDKSLLTPFANDLGISISV